MIQRVPCSSAAFIAAVSGARRWGRINHLSHLSRASLFSFIDLILEVALAKEPRACAFVPEVDTCPSAYPQQCPVSPVKP
jgi:hypothetical protein